MSVSPGQITEYPGCPKSIESDDFLLKKPIVLLRKKKREKEWGLETQEMPQQRERMWEPFEELFKEVHEGYFIRQWHTDSQGI
jgi:hypothetical protein